MASLKDKVVLLTGASRGIGAAAAREMAPDGPRLILCARSEAACKDIRKEVEAAGARAEVLAFDIASEDETRQAVETVLDRHGHIDVVVNNAGIGIMGSVADVPPARFLDTLQINVMGPYNMVAAVTPAMVERGEGAIVNITSARAFIPDRYYAAYCASKAALLSLTQCLHYDLEGTGVKIFAFSPGFTDTDLVRDIYSTAEFRAQALTPDQGQPPERPAKVIAWLAREQPEDLAGKHAHIQFNDLSLRAGLERY